MHYSIELFHQPTLMHNFLYFINNMFVHSTLVESGKENCALKLVDEIILFFREFREYDQMCGYEDEKIYGYFM